MANRLNILANDVNKDPETQLKQVNMGLQDIQNWANGVPTNLAVSYKEPQGSQNAETSAVNFAEIPNFTFNTVLSNTLCLINFALTLKGNGVIGITINEQLVQEIFFQTTGFTPVLHNAFYNLKSGGNTVKLQWRALNGSTISKANTSTDLGLNIFQLVSFV